VRLRGLVGACAVLIAALAATGCGSGGLTSGGDAALGKELFTGQGQCGSCHTLADAGTSGTTGPNLDDAKPALDAAMTQITNGGGGMPAFAQRLTEEQIQDVAAYVSENAGG
jgi:mono/diheme cytochrome c family protein